MIDGQRLQDSIDRSEITNLIAKSNLTRDAGLWDEHGATFHSKARFTSS